VDHDGSGAMVGVLPDDRASRKDGRRGRLFNRGAEPGPQVRDISQALATGIVDREKLTGMGSPVTEAKAASAPAS
jgi:hypothetical protein